MFFYLIYNSTLISKEINEKNKYTKVFLYGSISYIILHATLFIGGKEALLYSLKNYFWLFLLVDITTLILTYNSKHKNKITLDYIINNVKLFIPSLLNNKIQNKQNNQNKNINQNENVNVNQYKPINDSIINKKNKQQKTVTFNENIINNVYDYVSSDSDSDIDTDLDLEEFKQSLHL